MTAGFNELDQRMSNVTSIATKFGDRLQVRTILWLGSPMICCLNISLSARSLETLHEMPEV